MITVTEDTFDAKPLMVTEKLTEFGLRYARGEPCYRWYEDEWTARCDLGEIDNSVLVKRTVYALEPEVIE